MVVPLLSHRGLENRLNSFIQVDPPDQKGTETKPGQSNNPVPTSETNESSIAERTPFLVLAATSTVHQVGLSPPGWVL